MSENSEYALIYQFTSVLTIYVLELLEIKKLLFLLHIFIVRPAM